LVVQQWTPCSSARSFGKNSNSYAYRSCIDWRNGFAALFAA
jgi:hypothetical protein